MITLKEIRWDDCFSYGKGNFVRLDEHAITQIVGLNGSGKSSIPLIIEEVLFNKNSKGIKKSDIPNRRTTKDSYNIELDFAVDEKEYTLSVNRKSTIKVKLMEDGADISSHTSTNTFKTVLDLFGMDFKTTSQLFYQSTNTSLQFLTATDTNRKKFLIDLLHLEEYVEKFETFKNAVKDRSQSVAVNDSRVSTLEKWLSENKLEATDIAELLEIDISTEEDETRLAHLTSEIKNINEKNKIILINNDKKDRLNSIDISATNSIEAKELISYDDEQSALGAKKNELKSLEKSKSKLEALENVCPTCEQEIDSTFKGDLLQKDSDAIDSLLLEIRELEERISSIQLNNKQYTKKVQAQKEWEESFRSIDKNLPSSTLDKNALEAELKELSSNISSLKARIQELTKENLRRAQHNARVEVIEEQTGKFQAQLDEAKLHLSRDEHMLANLEILKKSFSTNGLIAYKIENMVKTLEEEANDYLAELSDGRFTIEFVVTNDKLNVELTDFGLPVDIMSLSTGELGRVNTATLLAIRKLMSKMSKNNLNVLFLDEVVSVLDDQGKERLVEVLLRENLNTFIVSHNWSHPLLEKLEVTKNNDGVSSIER
jgi:DNA repair exonuclease SbcCD ATPase subunit